MNQFIRKSHTTRKNSAYPLRAVLMGCLLLIMITQIKAQISFEKLQQEMPTKPRFILMGISSQTCAVCLMQSKIIKKNLLLRERLDDNVYYLSWIMEYESELQFNGEKFETGSNFVERYGKDEHGNLAYPIWLIFDKNYNVVYRYFGLLSAEKVGKLLNVLGEAEKSD